MKAVILAGGRGTRLAPYTAVFPKPLVPIGERPIIDIILRQLGRFGFTDVTISLGHLGHLISAYYANGALPGLKIEYVVEKEALGTAGSLALVSGLDSTFLAMNGDILTNIDYRALVEHHRASGAALTIASHSKEVRIDLGVLELDGAGRLTGYREKPVERFPVSMGIYVYEPRMLRFITPGEYLDFPTLVLRGLAAGEKICAYRSDALWLDIGRREDYEEALRLYAERQEAFLGDE